MNYGMFTKAGNELVADLVQVAKIHSLSSSTVMAIMDQLQKDKNFSEITDTEVRESVGEALGWYK